MTNVTIEVVRGDALRTPADVLVLKYAQGLYGVDLIAAGRLNEGGHTVAFPEPWSARLEPTRGTLAARLALFVGVPRLFDFRYAEIRRFATTALAELATSVPDARTITITMHGPGYGLDESEAFESEVAGLVAGVREGAIPRALERVQIVELDHGTAQRLSEQLATLIPDGHVARPAPPPSRGAVPVLVADGPRAPGPPMAARPMGADESDQADPKERDEAGAEAQRIARRDAGWVDRAGYDSEGKPHIFVAMPFASDLKDLFIYGITGAANAAGYVCERGDLAAYTGDVMDWVRTRIRSCALVVAEMTDANPNVYLEVGFAWGVGVPTVLIARDADALKFDVRGQRCLTYGSIHDLEQILTSELKALATRGG